MSKPSGYDDRSLVRARVSRLARLRMLEPSLPAYADGGGDEGGLPWEAPESIWKGNEPRPLLAVELCDATLIPRTLRFGGARAESIDDDEADARARLTVSWAETWRSSCEFANVCCASGERGGVRMGLFEIGDGGTNGKLSRIESARVDVVITDAIDMRFLFESPLSSWSARACCCSRAPALPLPPVSIAALCCTMGETNLAFVMRYGERGVLSAALRGVDGIAWTWSNPRWTRFALLMSAIIADA